MPKKTNPTRKRKSPKKPDTSKMKEIPDESKEQVDPIRPGQKIEILVNNDFLTTEFDESVLTAKQLAFVEEFMVDLNGTQAAIRSGYSEKTARKIASENLTKPDIQRAIRRRLRFRLQDVRLKQQWVLDELVNQYYQASQAVEVLDMWGKPTGLWKADRKSAIKCLELLGKHLGMFSDDKDKNENAGRVVIFQLPDNGRHPNHQTTTGLPGEDAQLES